MNAETLAVAESFSRAADGYDSHAGVQSAMASWLAEWLPAHRRGSALEVGAGTGGFTRHLADWEGRLLATDVSEAMCAAGRRRMPQVAWLPMAAAAPHPGPWHWILSSSMLQWMESPVGVFESWRSVLAPGGRVLGGLFVAGSLPELTRALGAAQPLRWRTAGQWTVALEVAGLRVIRAETERREFRHENARSLLRSLHGVGAAPQRRLAPVVLRRILADYDANHRSADGVRATWTFLRFEAQRP